MKKTIYIFIILILVNLFFKTIEFIQIEYYNIIKIHLFFLSTTIIAQKTYRYLNQKPNTSALYFLSINIGRIILSIMFLWPIIFSENPFKKQIIVNFVITYFVYLLFESIIQNQKSKISK